MTTVQMENTRQSSLFWGVAGTALMLAGLGYLVFRAIIAPVEPVDFRFFWLAGRLWQDGIDPYSSAFERIGAATLPDGNVVHYWFYPPQWWAISRLLATMSLDHAAAAWRLVSGLMVAVGTAGLAGVVLPGPAGRRIGIAAAFIGAGLLIEPSAQLLAFGQSSGLVFLGLACCAIGLIRQSAGLVALGVALSTFKPQFGIFLICVFLLAPGYRLACLTGLLGAGLLCLPQIVRFGPLTTIHEFIANVAAWGSLGSNTALTTGGPIHLLARIVPWTIDPSYETLIGLVMVVPPTVWLMLRSKASPTMVALYLTSAISAFAQLHIYDYTVLIVPLLILVGINRGIDIGRDWPLLIAFALTVRPAKVEALLSVPTYSDVSNGLISYTIAALIVFGVAVRHIARASGAAQSRPQTKSAHQVVS